MAASGLHISISAERVFSVGELVISNSILTSLVASGLLILFALAVRATLRQTNKPSGLQNVAEWIIESLTNVVHGVTDSRKKTQEFFPFIATFFFFIIVNNWLGLLPGVGTIGFIEGESPAHASLQPSTMTVAKPQAYAAETTYEPEVAPTHDETAEIETHQPTTEDTNAHGPVFVPYFRAGTADLNTTLALAIMSVVMVQAFGLKYLGIKYLNKYFNFSNPLMFFIGILELVSEFSKILSFAFRLFGNIFAGEVLLAVMMFLVALVVPMPFYGLELFVGFIQALVFSLLSVVFFNMATISHDEH